MTVTMQGRLRADQRPLYVQASEALRALVQSGGYAPGDRLPSEIELSQRLGISRPTLREAMRFLEEEGTIVRRHGVGTFVAAPGPIIEGGLEVLESIDRMAERTGLRTEMGQCAIVERPATRHELAGLGLVSPGEVTSVTRTIVADGAEVAFLVDVVPIEYLRQADLVPALQRGQEAFRGSVLDLFLRRGAPALAYSRTELSSEAADGELARALHVRLGSPLLRLEGVLYGQDGRAVDFSTSYFVPGFFRFHVIRRIG